MNMQKIIFSEQTPVVCIFRTTNTTVQRAMGFILKEIEPGIRIAVTARHNFMTYPINEFTFASGTLRSPFKLLNHSLDFSIKEDVCFLVLKDNLKKRSIHLFNPTYGIPNKSTTKFLSNTKCEYNPDYQQKQLFDVYNQDFREHPCVVMFEHYLTDGGEFVNRDNYDSIKEKTDLGWIQCEAIGMQSLPGCSGSAIFDEKMNIYGMNLRGGGPGKFELIYIPIEKIILLLEQNEKLLLS